MSELTETEVNVRIMHQNMQLFREAMLRAFQAVPPDDTEHIKKFISILFYKYKPYGLLQPVSVAELRDECFNDTRHRDFIWQLVFHYFSVLGNQGERIGELIINLVSGLLVNTPAVEYTPARKDTDAEQAAEGGSTLPQELADRVSIDYDPIEALSSNKWLIVVALLHLCYNYAQFEEMAASVVEPEKGARAPVSGASGVTG